MYIVFTVHLKYIINRLKVPLAIWGVWLIRMENDKG